MSETVKNTMEKSPFFWGMFVGCCTTLLLVVLVAPSAMRTQGRVERQLLEKLNQSNKGFDQVVESFDEVYGIAVASMVLYRVLAGWTDEELARIGMTPDVISRARNIVALERETGRIRGGTCHEPDGG